jgi:hypothetical protein
MNDLTKEYGAGPEAAGRLEDDAEIDPWIAFMRGEDPPSRRTAPQAKKPRGLIGLRKRGRTGQL